MSLPWKKLGSIRVCAAYFFGKIGCNRRFFVFLDKNNYFFKKTLFYFFVGYFILWKSLTIASGPVTRPTGRGVYFYDPDGFIVEIRCDRAS
jgi:hypothetical protein